MKLKPLTYAEIDLKAIRHNFKEIKKLARKNNSGVMAVVKADAYGHGAERIARLLGKERAEFFGVSDVPEGIALRRSGFKKPILVLESVGELPASAASAIAGSAQLIAASGASFLVSASPGDTALPMVLAMLGFLAVGSIGFALR